MNMRVINDPSSLGWEYDPDTGRWTWGGGSGSGGGGGNGSFPEAPVDGKQYGRQNAGWTEIVSGGGGGDVNLDGYATESWVGANFQPKGTYITPNDLNPYATKTWTQTYVSDNYQPKGVYLTTELDPVFTSSPAGSITQEMIDDWNSGTGGGGDGGGDGTGGNDPRISDDQISNWDAAYSWGETPGYVQAITEQQISDWDDAAGNGGGEDGPVTSVNGETGDVVLTPEIIGAEPEIVTKNTAFNKSFGTTTGTVAQGDASYTKNDSDTKYAQKAVTYTKTEGDARYSQKNEVYTKTEGDARYPQKNEVYTKSESDAKYELKGAGGGGASIGEGTAVGQITTWSGSSWVPSNGIIMTGTGAKFSASARFETLNNPLYLRGGEDNYKIGVVQTGDLEYHTFSAHKFYGSSASQLTMAVDGDATFTGTVDAAGFTVGGSPIGGGGGGLPDGGYNYGWNITATDFIATSDERLKDNIKPMPAGLIDGIKPVSWDWKDGAGKSAGVVAQQLQAIGLDDYVHEDDEGQLGVNYQALVAILLAEVISLKGEVEALKS